MRSLLFCFFISFSVFAFSAENPLSNEVDESTTSDQLENEQASEQGQIDSEELILSEEESEDVLEEKGPRRFIPTEQISQDLGVSFPVDI